MSDKLTPVNAEARGKVRLFRASLAPPADKIDRIFQDECFLADMHAWQHKGKKGRDRIEVRIRQRLKGLVEWVNIGNSCLFGTYLRASEAIIQNPLDPGESQKAVVVYSVGVNAEAVWHGLWTLEIPDHALGRIVQRFPSADLREIIWTAHREALELGTSQIMTVENGELIVRKHAFLLASPPSGAFLCEVIMARDVGTDLRGTYLRARTWFDRERVFVRELGDYQTPLQHGRPRLGEYVLLPPAVQIARKKQMGVPQKFLPPIMYSRRPKPATKTTC